MDTKKVLNGIKEDIQKSNSEYADIISKTKLSRVELLKTNNELQKKTEGNAKITEEYTDFSSLTDKELIAIEEELSDEYYKSRTLYSLTDYAEIIRELTLREDTK